MKFERRDYSNELLTELYVALLTPRVIEEKMINLIRQGRLTKWFSGVGQEAISVGCARALYGNEYILTMHRNLGVFTAMNVLLKKLFSQFQGKAGGFTKGRDRSFHFGSKEHYIIGMISHLGPQLGVADGIALWSKLKNERKAVLVFTGEGGTNEGDFHEALNVAAVWNLPVIFVIENNSYGLSTPTYEQYACKKIIDKGAGYGIEAKQIDGNNLLEVYSTIKDYAEEIRKTPRLILIEANTFRMNGHEEASGTKYIPRHLFEEWAKKDTIVNYERFLLKEKIINEKMMNSFRNDIKSKINEEWEEAVNEEEIKPNAEQELNDVYAPFEQNIISPKRNTLSKKKFVNAITDALEESMKKYPDLIIMGQDIAKYGGVFKVTKGFVEKFERRELETLHCVNRLSSGRDSDILYAVEKQLLKCSLQILCHQDLHRLLIIWLKQIIDGDKTPTLLSECPPGLGLKQVRFIPNRKRHGLHTLPV